CQPLPSAIRPPSPIPGANAWSPPSVPPYWGPRWSTSPGSPISPPCTTPLTIPVTVRPSRAI
ncbi:hypothetical protein, partial [Pseudomonas sp. FEN]